MTAPSAPSRRSFLKTAAASAAAITTSGSLAALRASGPVHSGMRAPLKIGLVGCGGRGSGAARQAIEADRENILWAMGDAFADHLQDSLAGLEEALGESGR